MKHGEVHTTKAAEPLAEIVEQVSSQNCMVSLQSVGSNASVAIRPHNGFDSCSTCLQGKICQIMFPKLGNMLMI